MSFYHTYCLPHLVNAACNLELVQQQRQKIVPAAKGRVLEVGVGAGLNLPFYQAGNVDLVWALEPSAAMLKMAQNAIHAAPFEIRVLNLPAEDITLDDNSVDTVLLTFTLCTIPDWLTALHQMRRVLRPGGQLLFCEHGLSCDENIQLWQHRLNPIWKKIAGGCNLNRPINSYLQKAGFHIQHVDTGYMQGALKCAGYLYRGTAI